MDNLDKVVNILKQSKHTTVFTGAGISVESGIPPFRGEDGLWEKYDPYFLHINYFLNNPKKSWELNKKLFYSMFSECKPNRAHRVVADLEKKGYIDAVITQNIDNLHQEAGSKNVYEFHGTYKKLVCMECEEKVDFKKKYLKDLPPRCDKCNGVLKPDYIFFGEGIPQKAYQASLREAEIADVFLVIGTTGEVRPASIIPNIASENGATIIEVNIEKSNFTDKITDYFLKGKATVVMDELYEKLIK
ncbi:MAG: NAD-dependent deacylase [Halanaerobiales bacterium]|nr:NAD-dependent deacylase [Halanaerobiales bacterium]